MPLAFFVIFRVAMHPIAVWLTFWGRPGSFAALPPQLRAAAVNRAARLDSRPAALMTPVARRLARARLAFLHT